MGNGVSACTCANPNAPVVPDKSSAPTVRNKRRAPRPQPGSGHTSPYPYPALFIQQSSGDIAYQNQHATSGVISPNARAGGKTTSSEVFAPPMSSTRRKPNNDLSPSTSAAAYSVTPYVPPVYSMLEPQKSCLSRVSAADPDGLSITDTPSSDLEDVAFVRKYDLFPIQWAYLERYASEQRERSDSRRQSMRGNEDVDDEDPYAVFFEDMYGTTTVNMDARTKTESTMQSKAQTQQPKLATPTQSFVWLQLVNNILDEQERRERVDAARSIGQSVSESKASVQHHRTRPEVRRPSRPSTPELEKKFGNPLNAKADGAGSVKPLTSVRIQLRAHGPPHPQPNLEDPRPEREARRARMAAHRAGRNYTKLCGYTLDQVAQWVDSPRNLSL